MKRKYNTYNIYKNGVLIKCSVPFSVAKKYINLLNKPSLFGGYIENDISLQIENINTGQIYEH